MTLVAASMLHLVQIANGRVIARSVPEECPTDETTGPHLCFIPDHIYIEFKNLRDNISGIKVSAYRPRPYDIHIWSPNNTCIRLLCSFQFTCETQQNNAYIRWL